MKKWTSFVLAAMLLLSLCACSGGADRKPGEEPQTEAATLQAGYARENITPDTPVGLSGYQDSATRRMKGVLDYIYATCVALRSGEDTILVFTMDMIAMKDDVADQVRQHVSKATNISTDHIIVGATHTHSGPDIAAAELVDQQWEQTFYEACARAGENALKDLAPAQLQATTTELENMNFVRHYEMNDGTFYGSNFGSEASGFKAHVSEADNQLILLKLDREEGKKDILMINWQAHPAGAARQADYNFISSDFVGQTRTVLENETGMLVAYFTGAAGNLNPKSLIESENTNQNGAYKEYGGVLAKKIMEVLPNLKTVEGANQIKTARVAYEAEINHEWDYLAEEAKEVYDVWKNQSKAKGDQLAAKYGMSSVYHANAICKRVKMGATETRELRVFRLGPIGFTSGTYEMFTEHSKYVKENSPFDITFVICGCYGYIPTERAYEYGSYESHTGIFAKGTGEALAQEYVKLLNSIA